MEMDLFVGSLLDCGWGIQAEKRPYKNGRRTIPAWIME